MQSSIPYENIFDHSLFDETCLPPSAPVNQPELTENYTYGDLYENELHGDEIYNGLLPSYPWEGTNQPPFESTSDDIPCFGINDNDYNTPETRQIERLNETLPVMPSGPRKGLPRRRSRYAIDRAGGRSNPVFIPTNTSSPLDPIERWRESPPEDEPAPMSAIINAIRDSDAHPPQFQDQSTHERESGISDLEINEHFRKYRRPRSCAASTTSAESAASASSRQSGTSGASSGDHGPIEKKRNDQSQTRVRKMQSSRRKNKPTTKDKDRPFCCTFCCDRFKSKYDWTRHEKSLHLRLENWRCAPFGGAVILPSTGRTHCAYCNMLDPTAEHLDQHQHGACEGQNRMFRRKDHLVQHLRLFHHLDTLPLIDNWKSVTMEFTSRCGFCGHQMASWDERANHLAVHFRSGLTMADWKGDHAFPPSIAAQVTHSVPPYLIGLESRTLVPVSATNGEVQDHLSQMLTRATFDSQTNSEHAREQPGLTTLPPEPKPQETQEPPLDSYTQVLTLHLSHFAQQQMRLGTIPTDEMFQQEARRLLFDSDDPWNQTIADHPQWLATFRRHHQDHSEQAME